jgi:hypothetical protein
VAYQLPVLNLAGFRVEIFGLSPRKRTAKLNGRNMDATMDLSAGKVALTIPDDGRGEVLELE